MKLAEKIAVNSGAQVAGQLVGMVSGLASVVIAARHLSLDDYGQVIAAMVLVSMFAVAGDFGMSAVGARQLARDRAGEQRLAASMLWAGIVFTALPVVLILAVSHFAYGGPEEAVTRTAVLILLSTFLLNPLRGVVQAFAIAGQRMYLVALAGVVGRLVSVSLVALFAALDAGPVAIAAAYAAANVMDDLATIVLLRKNLRFPLRVDRRQIRALIAAAVPLGLILLLNALYFKLDAFLLALLASDAQVALYGVAYKIFEMLLPLSGYVMIVLLPELAPLEPGEPRFGRLVEQAYNGLWLLALPIAALAICAPEIMTAIGGSAYAQGATVLVLVMTSLALATVNAVFGHTLVSQGRQGVLLKVSATVLAVNVGLNLILIPAYGAVGAGIGLVFTELLSLVATAAVYRRIARLPRPHRPLRMVLAGAAMAGGVSVKFLTDMAAVPTLVVAGVAGGLAYAGALWVLHAVPPPLADALRQTVGPRLRRLAGAS